MGEVIGKLDAVGDILADVDTTLGNALVRGGVWATQAEEKLRSTVALAERLRERIAVTAPRLVQARREREVQDERADHVLAEVHDEVYNLIGRPGANLDPIYEIMWPGGISAHAGGPVDEQPIRMEMLAAFLNENLHPRVSPAKSQELAAKISASADTLRTAVTAVVGPEVELGMLYRMQAVVARTGQIQLARLKRIWKGHGLSEAEIHQVIPDRPRARKTKAEEAAAAQSGGATPEADPTPTVPASGVGPPEAPPVPSSDVTPASGPSASGDAAR